MAKYRIEDDPQDVKNPLPSNIKGIYRAVDAQCQITGHIVIEATDTRGITRIFVLDTTQLALGRLDELAPLTVAIGLYAYQSPKGLRELSALINQAEKPDVYLANSDGYHQINDGENTVGFFIWKGEKYACSGSQTCLETRIAPNAPPSPRSLGSLAEWQENIGAYVVKNPYLLVVVSAAIASLLSRAFGLEKLILMLVGGSSQGKTTALRVGQSLIKSGASIESFSGTTKGITAFLVDHHDRPVFMDELRQADSPADIVRLIFDSNIGTSRKTSNASQKSVKSDALSCGLILANESTLEEIVAGTRAKINEGIAARFFELHLQAPHGIFHVLPKDMTAKQFAEHFQDVTARMYGAFWDALVPQIAKNAAKIREWMAKKLPEFEADLTTNLSINDPITMRMVRGMAAWACAGTLAVKFKLLNTDNKTVIAAIRLALQEHLERNTHGGHRIAEQVINTLRGEIDRNANKFPALATFHSCDQSGIYGYYRASESGGTYLILPTVFEEILGEKFGKEAAARALKTAGFLKADRDGYQRQYRIPGKNYRKRFYAISDAIRYDGSPITPKK